MISHMYQVFSSTPSAAKRSLECVAEIGEVVLVEGKKPGFAVEVR